MQLQPDYLSTEELRYAQINPQEYSTLRVRVTGFSGFFTSFDKDLQNEIINRTEHGKQ
jgi:formate C-acetyltransferase